MTRTALVALALLLAACKHAPPADGPEPGDDEPGDTTDACAGLDEAACRADADCAVMTGSPTDADGACTLPEEVVGCHGNQTACGDAITYATDENGNGWWFMDTCLPEGFTSADYPADQSEPPPSCL